MSKFEWKWNFNSPKARFANPEFSNTIYLHLSYETGYTFIDGWGNREQEHEAFANELRTILPDKKMRWRVTSELMSYACPSLQGPAGMDLYLHPMEITGYMLEKDIPLLLEKLRSFQSIKRIHQDNMIVKKVSTLSDGQYLDLLMAHVEEIKAWIGTLSVDQKRNCGIEFAKTCRLPRLGDATGVYASDDLDIVFVNNIAEWMKTA